MEIDQAEINLLDLVLFEKRRLEYIMDQAMANDDLEFFHYEFLVEEFNSYFRELLEWRARRRRMTDQDNYNTGTYNVNEYGYDYHYPQHAPAA